MDKTCVPPASIKHNIPVSPSAIRSTDKEDADTAAKINSLEKKTISVYVFFKPLRFFHSTNLIFKM